MQQCLYQSTDQNKILYIMRGLPGSGKSTLAHQLSEDVYSTDDYFMIDGEYQYDENKIGDAHQWNRDRTIAAMKQTITPLVIDNTNTRMWEFRPYVEFGMEYGYSVYLVEPETDWRCDVDVLAERNTHGVPRERIKIMLE
jgi:NEDD4-binding protein 2